MQMTICDGVGLTLEETSFGSDLRSRETTDVSRNVFRAGHLGVSQSFSGIEGGANDSCEEDSLLKSSSRLDG